MTDKEQWPEGATHKVEGVFTKWVEGAELNFNGCRWEVGPNSWSLDKHKRSSHKIIERPEEPAQYVPEVGDKIEIRLGGDYEEFIVLYIGNEIMVVMSPTGAAELCYSLATADFRPIKSERDVFIEKSIELTELNGEKLAVPQWRAWQEVK